MNSNQRRQAARRERREKREWPHTATIDFNRDTYRIVRLTKIELGAGFSYVVGGRYLVKFKRKEDLLMFLLKLGE